MTIKLAIVSTAAVLGLTAASPTLSQPFLFGFSPSGTQLLVTDGGSIQASQTGSFDSRGEHMAGNTNYIVGQLFGLEYRNYFSFNVSGQFTSGSLQIGNPDGGLALGSAPSLTWTLYDLGTTIDTQLDYDDISIFDDLGSGVVYGAVTISAPTDLVTVRLNSAGLAALNAAASGSGVFNVGGALGAVPEPASWAMLIAGFGLVGAALRRRRMAGREAFAGR